ncbi:MAG TPA: sulfotransferase [Thermoanaerobaculia bacterium]|jgi:hypothetical protein|nr:sulfotransferase [Thermoanaerobaculia bacterium]
MLASLPVPDLRTGRSDDLLANPAQVVVLGMHRSGTSAVTRVLNLMGCWAGPEGAFAPADEANPTGYWEHGEVWTLDEAVLQALGSTWCQTNGFDLARLDAESRAGFAERVRGFAAEMDRSGPWVIKDPRLCLLFPLWRPALERPVCVLVHRDPLPVARSLESRDGLPILHGIALWELYNREALAATRGLPRLLVSYRDLLEAPMATVRRLYAQMLSFAGGRLHLPDERELSAFVQPPLDHHPPDPDLERGYLNLSQSELLRAFATGTALDLDPVPPLSAGARDLLASAILAESAALRSRLGADLHRADGWITEMDGLIDAIFASRSWKIGDALARGFRKLLARKPETTAAERRRRLMDEVRRWRSGGRAP